MLQLATQNDRSRIIRIFQEAFIDNPHILYLLGNKRLKRKIAVMTSHVVSVSLKRDGIYFSEDKEGVLIVFEARALKLTFIEKLSQYWMVFRCFDWRQIAAISRTEKQVQLIRTCQPHDLYVWFYAVSDKALGGPAARELMKDLFTLANQRNAAIYAETSLTRNALIYQRFGFECYHQSNFDGFELYHLRKESMKE